MVRAGVVGHPREWRHGGWHEIVDPPRWYRIISWNRLRQLLNAEERTLTDSYKRWVEDYVRIGTKQEKIWTGAIAAGSAEFVEGIKAKIGIKGKRRRIDRKENAHKDTVYTLPRAVCCLQR